jgi:hypothetical protein
VTPKLEALAAKSPNEVVQSFMQSILTVGRIPIPVVLKQSLELKLLDLTNQGLGDEYLIALGPPLRP